MAKNKKIRKVGMEDSELTALQLQAVELCLMGMSDVNIAESIGCSRITVNRWRNHHKAFNDELNSRREETVQNIRDRVDALLVKSLKVLDETLDNKKQPLLRLKAAQTVLKAVISEYGI